MQRLHKGKSRGEHIEVVGGRWGAINKNCDVVEIVNSKADLEKRLHK